jgi:pyruvyl transferase EpsO
MSLERSNSFNQTYLLKTILPNETIFLQGGGNFGDLYRHHNLFRQFIIDLFPNNSIIAFPQTINYQDKSNVQKDAEIFNEHPNLVLTARSVDSYNFLKKSFPQVKSYLIADMAFMIGNLKPITKPIYDIFILRRFDNESSFIDSNVWKHAYNKYLRGKFIYKETDWHFNSHKQAQNNQELKHNRLNLVNELLSQGVVIITDRLHASIFSLLIGKPHIIINDKYKKIVNTRQAAFSNKNECESRYLNEFYVENPEEAVQLAVKILTR